MVPIYRVPYNALVLSGLCRFKLQQVIRAIGMAVNNRSIMIKEKDFTLIELLFVISIDDVVSGYRAVLEAT